MTLSMHSASVPVFAKTLNNLVAILDKAQAYAETRKFDPNNFLAMRLAPDMLPFTKQIQIASDNAKGCVARLAGVEIPKYEDTESSFDELRERLRKTIRFVESVPAEKFAGADEREVVLPLRSGEMRFSGENYLKHFALPNFFFHAVTAYALLRHGGVDLGKTDYLGGR